MKLVVEDLNDLPTQEFILDTAQRVHVMQVSYWVYANDVQASDTFEANIYDSDMNLVWTKALTGILILSYIDATNTYAHGKLNIPTENELILSKGTYTTELVQLTGYTANNFLSWARDWESTYQPTYSVALNDGYDPFYFRLYDTRAREVST